MALLKKLIKSFSKWIGLKSVFKKSKKKSSVVSRRRSIKKNVKSKKISPLKASIQKTIKKNIKSPSALPKPALKKVVVVKEELIGNITHYFPRIGVVVVKVLKGPIKVGDKIHLLSPKTDFVQKILSMQIESVDVKVAKKGQLIGLKVIKEASVGDKVYRAVI